MEVLEIAELDTIRDAAAKSPRPSLAFYFDVAAADYEEIDNEDLKCEYYDGVLVVHSPATLNHEDVTGFMLMLMRLHAANQRLGRVFGSNAVMQIDERRFSPDVSFLSNAGEARVQGGRVVGHMDLVVEVLSISTREYDRGDKLERYREGRVPEIWLIDPDESRVDAHVLDGDRYRQTTLSAGRLESSTLHGFAIMVEWLWRRPLPSEDECRALSKDPGS